MAGATVDVVVVVVGNPQPGSRTRRAAEMVARRLTGAGPVATVELAELGPALLEPDSAAVRAAKDVVRRADLIVFATPTYKATYTGLLKLFLDHFRSGELAQTPAVALMLGASPRHALAGEHTLKPVLTEIGCACPAPALFLLESEWADSSELEDWLAQAARAHALGAPGEL